MEKLEEEKTALPDHASNEVEQELIRQKCERFTKWCQSLGIMHPKIDYPWFFESGLIGCRVNTPISQREAFLFVPYTAVLSADRCWRDPDLKDFYAENPQLFKNENRSNGNNI
jgi:hypothetical protein